MATFQPRHIDLTPIPSKASRPWVWCLLLSHTDLAAVCSSSTSQRHPATRQDPGASPSPNTDNAVSAPPQSAQVRKSVTVSRRVELLPCRVRASARSDGQANLENGEMPGNETTSITVARGWLTVSMVSTIRCALASRRRPQLRHPRHRVPTARAHRAAAQLRRHCSRPHG